MSAGRSIWRVFVAILQVAALVAFLMPASVLSAKADAAHGHATHAHGQSAASEAGPLAPSLDPPAVSALHASAQGTAEDGPSHGACGLGCAACSCHAFAAAPDDGSLPHRRIAAQVTPPASDRTRANVTLEKLPEPPRPFA